MDTSNLQQQLPELLKTVGATTGDGGWNWPNIIGGLIFGLIGMIVLGHAKKERSPKLFCIAVVMLAFPYFVTNTVLIYAIGIGLCALLYFWRD